MDVISGFFTNLPVGRKLLVGFGGVLALTVMVAGTGFYAVETTVERSQQMNRLARINAGILEARTQERDFALTRAESSADALNRTLSDLGPALEELAARSSEAEKQELARIRVALDSYARHFEEYRAQLAEVAKARVEMAEAAQLSREEFTSVELEMYDAVRALRLGGDLLKGSDPLTLAEATSTLTKSILDLRTYEGQFISDSSQQAVDDWQGVYEDITRSAEGLKQWLNEDQKAAMDLALKELAHYKEAFGRFQQLRTTRIASEQSMAQQADGVAVIAGRALEQATEQMRAERSQAFLLLAVIGALAVLVGLMAAFVTTRLIVGPLRRTVEIAERVASGDLSHTEARAIRRDEIGKLQQAMQTMTQSLRTLIGSIGGGVSQIATAADQLSAITAQTSEGVQAQRSETEQTATAMHEMAATVQEVARNAEQASEAARQADREARQGDRVVKEAVGQIDSLAQEVDKTAEAITALNAESGRIGSVLEVIRSVAEQTNLLALNAAIEAARAGEQGRGFAVVADEVRALAMRTHSSTEEIEGLIANLQRVAQKAVEQMDSSRSLTQRTVTLAGEAGSALGRITDAVSTIEQMNQQIAAAAEEQTAVAEAINLSVTRVHDIGEQSATASEQIAGASAELARLGGELQGLMGRFRT